MAKKKKRWVSERRFATILIPLMAVAVALLGVTGTWFAIFWGNSGERVFLPNPLLDQAELNLAEENFDEAIANAVQAIEIEPENPRIWLVLYTAHELNGDREEAMQALQEGTRHVRRRATGGAELRATLAAAEISPEEGLATVVESYQSFGLRPFARRLLQVLVRVFEGTERFAVMLEEIQVNEVNVIPVAVPDNVFTYKDFEVLESIGVLRDGMLDVYAFAEKLGFSRSEVNARKHRFDDWPEGVFTSELGSNDTGKAWFALKLGISPNGSSVHITNNVPGIIFPGGITIGMPLDEVLDRFFTPAEKRTEITQAIMVGGHVAEREQILIYRFGNLSAYAVPKGYDESGLIFPPILFYHDHDNAIQYSIMFESSAENYYPKGAVISVSMSTYNERNPIQP